jgi:hypothetical protein
VTTGTDDPSIRVALRAYVAAPDVVAVDEIKTSAARADVVAVHPDWTHAYEIKSDRDSVVRLQSQVHSYSSTFDRCTIVASGRHLDAVASIVPAWWGILRATQATDGTVTLSVMREAMDSPESAETRWTYMGWCIWGEEWMEILRGHGVEQKRIVAKARMIDRLEAMIGREAVLREARLILQRRTKGAWAARYATKGRPGIQPKVVWRGDGTRVSGRGTP